MSKHLEFIDNFDITNYPKVTDKNKPYVGVNKNTGDVIYSNDIIPVDLGITFQADDGTWKKLLFADRNLGAASPVDTGKYFQFGLTNGHEKDENYDYMSTDNYDSILSRTELMGIDKWEFPHIPGLSIGDAAKSQLGDGWHIPTKDEWELFVKNIIFVENIIHDGSIICQSKINGNYIILPKGYYGFNYKSTTAEYFTDINYWSSTEGSSGGVYSLYEDTYDDTGIIVNQGAFALFGLPIRPVKVVDIELNNKKVA